MPKIQLDSFNGLTFTTASSSSASDVTSTLSYALVSLLQYHGNAVGDCDSIVKMEGMIETTAPRCIIAQALKAQILGSIGYPVDITQLQAAVEPQNCELYEPWEVQHVRAVLQLCEHRSCKDAARAAHRAVEEEPRDIFSLRLLFISSVLSAQYGVMYSGIQMGLNYFLSSTVDHGEHDCEKLHHRLNSLLLKPWKEFLAEPPLERLTESRLQRFMEHKIANQPNGVRSLIALPFLMTYYAFAIEEMVMDPKTCSPESHFLLQQQSKDAHGASEDLLVLAQEWNYCGVLLITAINAEVDVHTGYQPYGTLIHPFAMHTVCHIFEARGDPAGGLEAVKQYIPDSFWMNSAHLSVHCWWHVALFHLDLGNHEQALRTFDDYVAPRAIKEDPFGLCDVTAFLTRASIAGVFPPDDEACKQRFSAVDMLWRYHDENSERWSVLQTFPFFFVHALLSEWSNDRTIHRIKHPEFAVHLQKCLTLIPSMTTTLVADIADVVTAVEQFWEGRLDGWTEMAGSAAQRNLLLRLVILFMHRLIDVPEATSIIQSIRSALSEIVCRYPRQPYYANVLKQLE